ncbi:MAG: 2-dehydro-3-deoxy-D-gluconate 5-dehydrogenase KduD, partial [Desulfobacterales bacterium]|nr:2-dehydro-3-deoxy-D-gluconate 5-dehydrogenase KduD [Desulfobacterales bacterium]
MILDKFDLTGKVAIVSGSNTGLGQGIALALAEAGADILGISRRDGIDTKEKIEAIGRSYVHLQADLSSTQVIPEIIDTARETFGGLDILVNNAGIIRRNEAMEFSEAEWDSVMNVNIRSLFFLSQAAAREMRNQEKAGRSRGGKIINVASMLSYQGGIRVCSYTASKSGVLGLTRALANEWAGYGINVNGIAPGYMRSDNTKALREDKTRNRQILERIPAGRWGEPEDLGGTAVFLASDASNY